MAAGVDLGLSYDSPSAYYEYPDNAYGYNSASASGLTRSTPTRRAMALGIVRHPSMTTRRAIALVPPRHLCTTLRPVTSRQSAMLAAKAAVAAHEPARAALVSRRHVARPVRTLSSPVPLLVTGPVGNR